MANVEIIHEVCSGTLGDWNLCFQWGRYVYDDGSSQTGYRFIWRKPDGNLQAARGQARIPCAADMFRLIQMANEAGWFITTE
jgi:hypothetical protein